mgnify:FL=1
MEQTEFEQIAKSTRAKAVATALALSMSKDEAEDIAQDVMLKLWTLRNDINSKTDAEKLAVCIARNKAIDRHRKRPQQPIDGHNNIIDSKIPAPDICVEIEEDQNWLMKRVAELPPKEYQILKLRQVEHKSNEEIAKLLGMEKTSVATLLSRARMKILKEFQKRAGI